MGWHIKPRTDYFDLASALVAAEDYGALASAELMFFPRVGVRCRRRLLRLRGGLRIRAIFRCRGLVCNDKAVTVANPHKRAVDRNTQRYRS